MRVLHLVDRLNDRGGAAWHLLGLLEALSAEHDVHVAAGRVELAGLPFPVHHVPGLAGRLRAPAPSDLETLVAEVRPDVVHAHTVVNPAALEWAADHGAVITVQDHRYFCPARGKWTRSGVPCHEAMRPEVCADCFEDEVYFREILSLTEERLAAVRRMRVVVLSHYMADELAAVGVPRERLHVIPPFVHGLEADAEPDGPPCVAFIGRLVEAKGVFDAVEAWRLSGIDLPLVFAGTGPLRDTLERGGFDVRGWLSHAQLSHLLARARAVLMPSRWQEPFGIAGLEALSMGVPVVAWESGGIAEWHPGPLVEWGDVASLAQALSHAVTTRATPAPGFEPDRLMALLLAVYQTAAAGQGL